MGVSGMADIDQAVVADFGADIAAGFAQKQQMLSAHESQAAWLGTSQGASSLIAMLDAFSSKVGELSGNFRHAEGWWRHSHLGFCREDADPIRTALGALVITRKDH